MTKTFTRLILIFSTLPFLGCLNPTDSGMPFVGLDSKNRLVDQSIDSAIYRVNLTKGIIMAQDSAIAALEAHDKRNVAKKLESITIGFGLDSSFIFPNVVTIGASQRVRLVFARESANPTLIESVAKK